MAPEGASLSSSSHESERSTKYGGGFPKIDFDVVLKHVGSFGRYQMFLLLLSYYVAIPVTMNNVGSMFLAAIPEHRCRVPEVDENREFFANISEEQVLQATTPRDESSKNYDGCRRYEWSGENCTAADLHQCFTNETTPCEDGYVYDTSVYGSTIATEWDLVCDRLSLGTISTTIYFCGIMLSAVVGGNLSDRFGRTWVLLCFQLLTVGLGVACTYSPNLASFTAIRFFIACFGMSTSTTAFVYMLEVVGDKWRTCVGITIQGFCGIAFVILSALSDRWREWRQLQMALAMSSAVFVLLWFFLPESPRWLFSKGKIQKGKKISHTMARRNGRVLPKEIWNEAETKEGIPARQILPQELLKRPYMRTITLHVCFMWFVISTVYYGLSLNITSFTGDDRINNAISGICELLACPVVILTMDRFGRRPILAVTLFVGGVACLIATVANALSGFHVGLSSAATAFGLVGKLAVSCSFAVIYNFTGELFPTIVRGTAIGTGSMAARIGSVSSPLIVFVQHYVTWLPSALFGLLSLVAGFTCLRLPETNKINLMTTMDEAENFYKASGEKKYAVGRKSDYNV